MQGFEGQLSDFLAHFIAKTLIKASNFSNLNNFQESLDISEHSARLDQLIDWFERKGINVTSGRIEKYKRILESFPIEENFDPRENEDHKIFDELMYVYRETHELMWIQKGLEIREPEGIENILKLIVGGKTFARDDEDTSARNYQFELRIASYFLQNSYDVDMARPTDIIAQKNRIEFHLECKRLYSRNKIKKRIREAAKQLKMRVGRSELFSKKVGIAVFDVTGIAFPHQGLTWGVSDEHCKDVIQTKLLEIEEEYDFIEPFRGNKNVIGVWSQIHIPSLNLSLGQPGTRFSSNFSILAPEKGFRAEAFKEFQEVYEVTDLLP